MWHYAFVKPPELYNANSEFQCMQIYFGKKKYFMPWGLRKECRLSQKDPVVLKIHDTSLGRSRRKGLLISVNFHKSRGYQMKS